MILLERPNIEIALQNYFRTNNAKNLLKSRAISVTRYSNQFYATAVTQSHAVTLNLRYFLCVNDLAV
jgi:hypothetical protein